MSTHTPGPWAILKGHGPRKVSNFDRTYRLSVYAPGSDPRPGIPKAHQLVAYGLSESREDCIDNARLIAAAPELLRCLDWAMVWLPKFPLPAHDQELRDVFAENLEACNRTIAKAEGR